MTLSFWMAAEKWYHFWAPVSLGIIMLLGLVMAFALTKWKTRRGKNVLKGAAIVIGILAVAIFFNNQRYESYLEPASHVTPVIRHMQYKAFQGYQPLTQSTVAAYARYHDPDGVMATGLYNEEIVAKRVDYLGKKHRHHYFEYEGKIFKQYEASVNFDPSESQTAIIGTLHHLKDSEFESIGFNDTSYIFYVRVVIAEEDTGKTYAPEDEFLVPTLKDIFLDWTFRYY